MENFKKEIFLDIFGKSTRILVVAQQKWSNWDECKNRVCKGIEMVKYLKLHWFDVIFAVVGGATNGVPVSVVESWVSDAGEKAIVDNTAGNTKEKTLSIAQLIKENNIELVIQSTSLYHSLRAYLTLKKTTEGSPGLDKIKIINIVVDSSNINVIRYALADELVLAKSFEKGLSYESPSLQLLEMDQEKTFSDIDMAMIKYINYRVGEAKRIVKYSEINKKDLKTDISFEDIIKTYFSL